MKKDDSIDIKILVAALNKDIEKGVRYANWAYLKEQIEFAKA